MKNNPAMKFKIQNLLRAKDSNTISGPMSPVLFAKEMGQQLGFKISALLRVNFEDEKTHQFLEDGGLTGFDTLILVRRSSAGSELMLFVDEGVHGVPAGLWDSTTAISEVALTPLYEERKYLVKCDKTALQEIFTAANELLNKEIFPTMDQILQVKDDTSIQPNQESVT